MVDFINQSVDHHIITIEDPIEFYHEHKKSTVNQREVGVDVPSFAEAIRRALRQDPDVILVGELRDLETIEAAITAAETGHIVFGTLHTNERPGHDQPNHRRVSREPAGPDPHAAGHGDDRRGCATADAADRRRPGGGLRNPGRHAGIANLIRENKVSASPRAIQTGAKFGMQLMDDHLFTTGKAKRPPVEDVLAKANVPDDLANDGSPCRGSDEECSTTKTFKNDETSRSYEALLRLNKGTSWQMRRIGQILVDLGFITDEQLDQCCWRNRQQRPGESCWARSPKTWG